MKNEIDFLNSFEIVYQPAKNNSPKINFLHELFSQVTELPCIIRDRICQECNWSTQTFYRRIKTIKDKESRSIKSLSNAEKKKVAEVFHEEYDNLLIRFANCERDINKFI
ncbi:hypothetical protein CLV51_11068 [Chitinophaga niastensis]|uniref:Uncharacterized protein n=1 Tax=Chitinophaga niastensis TaxID=536980 RepID=A0A2P8H9E9_CHINA|nr:hypothetical protein CLV51_11068 [Chitinophaga niastensis]